jgi:CBS domain-containing protein
MKVQDVMTRDVRTCRPDTNLAEAVREMWEADCGVLPVVGDEGHVVGLITDRDICVALATKGRTADRVAVREVARGHVYTCLETDATTTALKTMQEQKVRRLPVVDEGGHLRGMLSLNDIVTHAGAATPAQIANALAEICQHRRAITTATAA